MKFLNLARLLALLPLTLVLTQCDQVGALFGAKKPGPYAFDLVLKMSPKADAATKPNPDGLFVDAYYYGDAAPAYRDQADTLNRIYLGRERWSYDGKVRRVHLEGESIDTSKLSQTSDGLVRVLVSVDGVGPSGDRAACHDYNGPIRQAQQKTPVLQCEFDAERYWENAATETPAK